MSKAIIIEDEIAAQQLLSNILKDYCPSVQLLGVTNSLSTSLSLIQEMKPDILFMDIELEDCTAFDILKEINHKDYKIIFTTAYDEYALKAFKFDAIDYLLKPYTPQEVIKALSKVEKRSLDQDVLSRIMNGMIGSNDTAKKKIALTNSDGIVMVDVDNIVRIEADRSYCYIYESGQTKMTISKPMIEVEKLLPEHTFFRSHASHIININYLRRYSYEDGGMAILIDGTQVPVSRRKKQDFLDFIKQ